MKIVKEFGIILLISFAGELLHSLLPLPVPASIYGMALMFFALLSGILKVEQLGSTWKFLVDIMPVMFIPAGVGLLDAWGVLSPVLVPVVTIMLLSTVIVMAAAGRVTQAILRINSRKNEEENRV